MSKTEPKNKNMKVVRCPKCKQILTTWATKGFQHCDGIHTIEGNIFQQKKIVIPNENTDDEIDKNPEKYEELEIEENEELEEKVNEISTQKENLKDNFKCPECNAEVELYKDCENCGAEIIWSEE